MRTSWSLTVLLSMLLAFCVSAPAEAGSATHLVVSRFGGDPTAGNQVAFLVNPQDETGATDSTFRGTVHFTSSDPRATLPSDLTITGGAGGFVTFGTAGSQTVTATATLTDGSSITGTSSPLTIAAGPPARLGVAFPTLVTSGVPFTFTITAFDAYGNRAAGYGDLVQFTSSDATATIPADVRATSPSGTFSATLRSAGTQTITATDPSFGPVFAATATIFVARPATHLQLTGPASTIGGAPALVGVRALDADGALAATYGGTVHFTSSDARAKLPADVKLVNGQASVLATFGTAGRQTIAAADVASPAIAGRSDQVVVGFVAPPPQPPVGGAPPPAGGGGTPPAPAIRGLAVRPLCVSRARLLSAPKRGGGKLALSFTLSAGARVSVALQRLVHAAAPARCPRTAGSAKGAVKLVKTLSGSAVAGRNALAIASRAGRRTIALAAAAKPLAPGAYVVRVQATNAAGRRSATATAKFFVLR
jgi:hypothetical protein